MPEIQYSPAQDIANITLIESTYPPPQNETEYLEYHVADMLWSVCSPILLCIGITGNTLSFFALQGPVLRTRVSSLYLKALSVVDTFALIFGLFPIWPIHLVSYDVTSKHDAICKIRNFLFYTFSDNSVWLICAFTFDRFIAVVFPFRKRSICTKKHAVIAILIVFCLSVTKNMEILITRGLKVNNNTQITKCVTPNPMHDYYNTYVRPWVVFTFVTAIPFIFITTCNIVIIKQFFKIHRSRSQLVQNATVNKPRSQLASMTRMCLTVSFTFLILVSPSIILLIGRPYWTKTPAASAKYYLARSFGNLCQYTQNSINFVLYCGSGRLFRRELINVVTCNCARKKPVTTTFIASREEHSCTNLRLVEPDRMGYNTIVSNNETEPCMTKNKVRFV